MLSWLQLGFSLLGCSERGARLRQTKTPASIGSDRDEPGLIEHTGACDWKLMRGGKAREAIRTGQTNAA